mmetsp:Transcript_21720/g.53173  ORF Transcript_21720/g.53173 Transcript_21720/m.53173 type:complete len:285 (-) Transcript_21720:12-866(-)
MDKKEGPSFRSAEGLVVVTGASRGIGRATAKHFAEKHPEWAVVLVVRPTDDPSRAKKVANKLHDETKHPNIIGETVDVSDWKSVLSLATRVSKHNLPVLALCNIAGECPQNRKERNGIEVQFGTNVLGYHFMTRAFENLLKQEPVGRIVNVASDWADDLDLKDVQFEKRSYDNDIAYRQSKQCNRMLTVTWSERLADSKVLVNSCHPGDPCTKLSCSLGYNMQASEDCSFCTCPYWLATNKDLAVTGKYFGEDHLQIKCRFAGKQFATLRGQLFELCEKFCIKY